MIYGGEVRIMAKAKRRGVIFDLDGTLWDATAVTARAWDEVLGNHGNIVPEIQLTEANVKLYMGFTN